MPGEKYMYLTWLKSLFKITNAFSWFCNIYIQKGCTMKYHSHEWRGKSLLNIHVHTKKPVPWLDQKVWQPLQKDPFPQNLWPQAQLFLACLCETCQYNQAKTKRTIIILKQNFNRMREKWTAVFRKKKNFLPFSFHLVLGGQVTFQTKKKEWMKDTVLFSALQK